VRSELDLRLDIPLPDQISIGAGSALFVCGTCFHRAARIHELVFFVDGEEQPAAAHSMPRLDFFRSLHPRLDPYAVPAGATDPDSPEDPLLHSYLSGFWGVVAIPPTRVAEIELAARVRLDDGSKNVEQVASISVAALPEPPSTAEEPHPEDGPLVAIAMATYEPPGDLLRRQLESIRAQTHRNWVCVISDDCSSDASYVAIRDEVGTDPRFVMSRAPHRLGFFRNFERALSLVPEQARYVALADQDDFWYPDKLATLLEHIGQAQLVYSDARVVSKDGAVLAETYWSRRRNNYSDLLSLLVANSVTGAASLFRRELLDAVLPFPPSQFAHFHDHWIGLVALSLGEIEFVDRPLYDYVQHGTATLGHAAANRMLALRDRLGSLRRDPHERVRMWRLHYFVDVARLTVCATILLLRCGDRMASDSRRVLERFLRTERSPAALAQLWARGARELLGRPETLGAEWMLAYAFTWRRLLGASRTALPRQRLRLDAVPPPDLALAPGRRIEQSGPAQAIADKIAPLALRVSADVPQRVNLLIPTIDLEHFFGGYIAKFNLARRLAEHGARVRIVTVDPVGALPRDWRATLERYGGLSGLFERVEVEFASGAQALEVSPSDAFVATTWWTAHVANDAVRAMGAERFLYLIQEYEPFTFPMGTYAALATQSYDFPHNALFSSELLRGYFRRHAIGIYGEDAASGDQRSRAFENAISDVAAPSVEELASRPRRRLVFYARPEPHASRNMFELGMLALERAVARDVFDARWELHGIGTVEHGRVLGLGRGIELELLPRSDQSAYAALLREHDVGLALMYTPHPSLVPIEMAAAGMVTVTNTFENKTSEAMARISRNIDAAPPTIDGIADALARAVTAVEDYESRVRGSDVAWSRDWNRSFSDQLIGEVLGFLRA
jgi:glycosyltransferase involved in cell wall biosynthesis